MNKEKTITIKFKKDDNVSNWSMKGFKILEGMLVIIDCTDRDIYFNLDTIENFEVESVMVQIRKDEAEQVSKADKELTQPVLTDEEKENVRIFNSGTEEEKSELTNEELLKAEADSMGQQVPEV